jgi:hypothetical protein
MEELILFLDVVLVKEGVIAKLTLQNISDHTLHINARFCVNSRWAPPGERDLSFEIVGPEGPLEFLPKVRPTPMNPSFVRALKPKETVETVARLSEDFSFDKPGKYQITATYENWFDFHGQTLWKGKLVATKDLVILDVKPGAKRE